MITGKIVKISSKQLVVKVGGIFVIENSAILNGARVENATVCPFSYEINELINGQRAICRYLLEINPN